ncbi:MAG: DegT/DnrJ/EryC1/StrS aminotransferase family protein [Clostridia bacterium]|nr:DegT/DnrJ/EryC1/StrS aminotransferase family protein [Clostridia bacterium]
MKKILFSPPDITQKEIAAVTEVLKSGWITTGPKTREFEKKISDFCHTKKTICMNSATACMESALRLLEIEAGDEVIVTPYTYTASCSVICHVGAKPVMVDLGENSFEMNYEKVLDAINEKTKAIIPVDLGGILCDYDKIFEIVNLKKNIFKPKNKLQEKIGRVCVIADSAHSFGAKYKNKISGEIADFTAFSFHAVKNLTTGEGGALTWNIDDDDIYKKLSLISLHGQNKDALAKTQLSNWVYDILTPGYKYNMADIMAAIGLVQLERFEELIQKRRELAKIYNDLLKNLNVNIYQTDEKLQNSSVHLYISRLINQNEAVRNKIIQKLAEAGIATNVHYKPLPMLTAYKKLGFNINNFPNAFKIYENEITLPLHTLMKIEDIEFVCKKLKEIID